MKKTTNKKLRLALILTVAAVFTLVIGAFALFSAYDQSATTGKNGTVGVEIDGQLTLGNSDNINPGDGDCNNPADSRPGTNHPLDFSVKNTGNKSIVTRNRLVISVKDKNGVTMDPTPYHLMYMDASNNYVELAVRTIIYDSANNPIAIQYLITGKSFNGVGAGAEIESEVGMVPGGVSHTYNYFLMLKRDADNAYQGADVSIELFVEAMQYRNTNNDDWTAISTKQISAGGSTIAVVPAQNEDANGNIIP